MVYGGYTDFSNDILFFSFMILGVLVCFTAQMLRSFKLEKASFSRTKQGEGYTQKQKNTYLTRAGKANLLVCRRPKLELLVPIDDLLQFLLGHVRHFIGISSLTLNQGTINMDGVEVQ